MPGIFSHAANAMRLALLLACIAPVPGAHAQTGLVYVSGQGFSVSETLRQALAENQRSSPDSFWVVITGADVALLTKAKASVDIRSAVQRVRERGGFVYVCDSDLALHRIHEEELLDGVARVRGYQAPEQAGLPDAAPLGAARPPVEEDLSLPESMRQSRLIWKACADRRGP
ncbi:MAG: hypothetical protein ACREX0_10760 [Noviherbaspirillum sp.]